MSVVIGLTGSIATGKSTASAMLKQLHLPVFDADAAVHQLMQPNTVSFKAIKEAFPKAIKKGEIDRRMLGKIVFADSKKLAKLEAILHPIVRQEEEKFIRKHCRQRMIVLDIPLLYETEAENLCDEVWVTWCPPFMQRQRMMRREGMTAEKCEQILARQMPQKQKIAQAARIIPTGLGKGVTMQTLKRYVGEILQHA